MCLLFKKVIKTDSFLCDFAHLVDKVKKKKTSNVGKFNTAEESNVQKVRGWVVGCFWHSAITCTQDAKFSDTLPANLLPLILAFFSSLFQVPLSHVPLFFYSSLGFKRRPSPSLISTEESCLLLQKNVKSFVSANILVLSRTIICVFLEWRPSRGCEPWLWEVAPPLLFKKTNKKLCNIYLNAKICYKIK